MPEHPGIHGEVGAKKNSCCDPGANRKLKFVKK
jgi:hypothetical protein